VLALYVASFCGVEWWRHRLGPWEVTFSVDGEGNPSLVIYQPRLNISSVELIFPGERLNRSNMLERVAFERPGKPIPFGKVMYEDLTTLPGVITMDLFGHIIEIFPRALLADRKETEWKTETTIELAITNKTGAFKLPPQQRE
jgi:hypothetical protein